MASKEFGELLEMLRSGGFSFSGEADIATMRAGMDSLAVTPPPDVRCETTVIGGIPGEWIAAPGATAPGAVLYLHGGGYLLGSPASHRDLAIRISRASGFPVFTAAYRLAPEHPYPAALDDALAAYHGLLASGLEPERVAIAGDSAGGGLALGTTLALKAAGAPLPGTVVAISPWADLALTGASIEARGALDPIIASPREGIAVNARQYLGDADAHDPFASPLYGDFAGFPPLLVQVGTSERLFDDAARVAARACEAGVPVSFEPWPEMVHVWHMFAALIPEGRAAIDRIGAWLRARLNVRAN